MGGGRATPLIFSKFALWKMIILGKHHFNAKIHSAFHFFVDLTDPLREILIFMIPPIPACQARGGRGEKDEQV